MLDAIVYFLVFGLLLQTSRGIDNFIGYLIIGVTFFPPLQRAVTGGSQVIVTGRNLIRGFSFPRAALPASYTIRSAIDLVPPMIALLVLVVVLPPHAWPSWHWVLIVPVLALQVLLSLGLTLAASRITTTIPDMRNIWPFLTQFWFYASGVFFSYERFINHPVMLRARDLNPDVPGRDPVPACSAAAHVAHPQCLVAGADRRVLRVLLGEGGGLRCRALRPEQGRIQRPSRRMGRGR